MSTGLLWRNQVLLSVWQQTINMQITGADAKVVVSSCRSRALLRGYRPRTHLDLKPGEFAVEAGAWSEYEDFNERSKEPL